MQAANQVIAEIINGGYDASNMEPQVIGGKTIGTKREVWNGSAMKTSGGLRKKDLMYNSKRGRIVSRRKHEQGLKAINFLHRAGYKAKKGEFRLFSRRSYGSRRSRRSRRGGSDIVESVKAGSIKAGSIKAGISEKWTLL